MGVDHSKVIFWEKKPGMKGGKRILITLIRIMDGQEALYLSDDGTVA
jgi:hypothetical protein